MTRRANTDQSLVQHKSAYSITPSASNCSELATVRPKALAALRLMTSSGEWVRTFAIITTDANKLVAEIHDRMPLIFAPGDYARWLGEEPDPGDLMRPFPAEPMRMWPISTRVNKPENDDPSIVEPIELVTPAA
jgi:putative SOS response-associated peptidase YedK